MQGQEFQGCVLLLCGLPAAGKSTLATRLVQDSRGQAMNCEEVCVWHVCFDDEIGELNFGAEGEKQVPEGLWKEQRRQVLHRVKALLSILRGEEPAEPCGAWGGFVPSNEGFSEKARHVVIIDDNMFYRSMRHEYIPLARAAQCGVAIAALEVSVEEALCRNRARMEGGSAGVPDDVILKMEGLIEWPDPTNHTWERFTTKHRIEADTAALWSLIQQAAAHPIPPIVEPDREQQARDRELTSANARHQLDLACRGATSSIMADAAPEAKKAYGKTLASAKKELLEAAKGNVEQLEETLTMAAPEAKDLGEKVLAYMQRAIGAL